MKAAVGDVGWRERCRLEDASFLQFIHVDGERTVPEGIVIFGITGGFEQWATIYLPGAVLRAPIEDQLAALPRLMRAYLKEYRGACPFFGSVTGFKFCRYRDHYQFNRDGNLVGRVERPFWRGLVEISIQ